MTKLDLYAHIQTTTHPSVCQATVNLSKFGKRWTFVCGVLVFLLLTTAINNFVRRLYPREMSAWAHKHKGWCLELWSPLMRSWNCEKSTVRFCIVLLALKKFMKDAHIICAHGESATKTMHVDFVCVRWGGEYAALWCSTLFTMDSLKIFPFKPQVYPCATAPNPSARNAPRWRACQFVHNDCGAVISERNTVSVISLILLHLHLLSK